MRKSKISMILVATMIGGLVAAPSINGHTVHKNNVTKNSVLLAQAKVTTRKSVTNEVTSQWIQKDGNWYYQLENGTNAIGWQDINGTWYYFNNNGTMFTGWICSNNKWYYMDNSGAMVTGWALVNNQWYYMDNSGAMLNGWQLINGKWYLFDNSGAMQTGWSKSNNKWYYMTQNGAMATSWTEVDGTWYLLDNSGAMQTGWVCSNNVWYYLTSSGAMATGWDNINNEWYYFNSNGGMQTGWQQINNTWYYMDNSGAMQTGWLNLNGTKYYLNSSGAMATGWQEISGSKYYFNSSGAMLTGKQFIDGYIATFNKDGVLISYEAQKKYTNENYNSTLTDYVAAQLAQYNKVMGGENGFNKEQLAKFKEQLTNAIDPKAATEVYQFLNIASYRNVNEEAFAKVLDGKGVFSGQAQAFIGAAKEYNLDPVYFMSQSALETGWGTSNFAKGITINEVQKYENGKFVTENGKPVMIKLAHPVTVYNLFGIGAFDSDPTVGATTWAYMHGWTSVSKAIYGAAQFLHSQYLDNQIKQDTPYELRYINAPLYDIWHQYSTDIQYAQSIGQIIDEYSYLYSPTDTFVFNVPRFKGMSPEIPSNLKQTQVTQQEFAVINKEPVKNTVESNKVAKAVNVVKN